MRPAPRQFSVNGEDANNVLNFVNNLKLSNIKPLSLTNVLKFLCSVYQERKKSNNSATAMPLHVYCYEFFISNYGLKKIAEDKLKKVIY